MAENHQIVLTGANGFVARNVRKYLSENNVKLISISRKDFVPFQNEEKIISENYDEKKILPKIQNSDAIIHLVGIGKQSAKIDYNMVNVELTRRIITLSKKAKIKKFVYTSGLGVASDVSTDYFISKYKAEQLIVNSGLDYTIFRPSYIVGKDDHFTRYLKKQIKKKLVKIPGSGTYLIQPIFINDVAKILYLSITQIKFKNKILDLVGSERITFEKYVKSFSKATRTKIKKINLEEAYHDAINNPKSDFGIDDLNILIGNFKGDHTKLQKITGMKFQSVMKLQSGGLF